MPIYTIEGDTNPIVHFGTGDILISKSRAQDCEFENEILLIPVAESHEVNSFVSNGYWQENFAGKSSAEIPVHVRLKFDKVESIDALVETLQELREIIVSASDDEEKRRSDDE